MVEIVQPPQPPAQGSSVSIVTFIVFAVIGLIILIIIGVGIFLVVRWVIGMLKKRSDLFYAVKNRMAELATTHAYKKLHRWRYWKNIPIRLVMPNGKGIKLSEPIGFYGGHFYSHSGNIIIRFFGHAFKDLWVIPRAEIIIINEKKVREYEILDKDVIKTVTQNLPTNLVQFNENEVLLFAYGIDNADSQGMFYMPVLKDKNGDILNLSLALYESMNEIALGDAWLSSSKLFVEGIRQSVEANPNVRIQQKIADASSNVETRPNPVNQQNQY